MFDHALDVMASEGYTYGKSRIISRTVEFIPFTAPRMVGDKKRKGLSLRLRPRILEQARRIYL